MNLQLSLSVQRGVLVEVSELKSYASCQLQRLTVLVEKERSGAPERCCGCGSCAVRTTAKFPTVLIIEGVSMVACGKAGTELAGRGGGAGCVNPRLKCETWGTRLLVQPRRRCFRRGCFASVDGRWAGAEEEGE